MTTSTVRTATQQRLVAKIATLPGFQASPDADELWWVTPPPNDDVGNKRWVIIGAYQGLTDPEAMAAGHGPTSDQWTIGCAAAVTGVDDQFDAMQQVEDAYNAVADMLAADDRLTLAGEPLVGCQHVTSSLTSGPNFLIDDKGNPVAILEFDIDASALISRNITPG